MVPIDIGWIIDDSWSLFLDRDGVINERLFGAYVLSKQDFIYKDGVLEISAELFSRFSNVFVITNQQCIGKGMISSSVQYVIHITQCTMIVYPASIRIKKIGNGL